MRVVLQTRAPCVFCQFQALSRPPRRLDLSLSSQPPLILQQARTASTKRAILPKRKPSTAAAAGSHPSTARSPSSKLPKTQQPSTHAGSPAFSALSPSRQQPYMNAFASFTSLLASKSTPTVLYTASESNAHLLASHLVAAFCVSYGAYHIYDVVLTPHPGLTAVIPYMMGGVCAMMIAGGSWVSLSALRVVKTLEAVPSPAAPQGLRIRLARKRLLPSLPALFGGGRAARGRHGGAQRALEVDVGDIVLGKRVSTAKIGAEDASGRPLTVTEVEEARERDRREREGERSGGAGARAAGALSRGMASFGRIFSRDGFVRVHVKGRGTWRMDIRTGRCAEDGLMMDRLFKYRTESGLFSG